MLKIENTIINKKLMLILFEYLTLIVDYKIITFELGYEALFENMKLTKTWVAITTESFVAFTCVIPFSVCTNSKLMTSMRSYSTLV